MADPKLRSRSESEASLEALVGRRTTSREVESVLASLVGAGTCCAARAWVYMANEGVLEHPAGELLRAAARQEGLSVHFDLAARSSRRRRRRSSPRGGDSSTRSRRRDAHPTGNSIVERVIRTLKEG